MKKQILTLLFAVIVILINGQTKLDYQPYNKFFKTYEDYKSIKPVDGIIFVNLKGTSVEYNENGTKQKKKPAELPYSFFCDHNNMLMRAFDGDLYYVVADGAICFYIKVGDGTVYKPDNADYSYWREI